MNVRLDTIVWMVFTQDLALQVEYQCHIVIIIIITIIIIFIIIAIVIITNIFFIIINVLNVNFIFLN